jgi:hypothetical protein
LFPPLTLSYRNSTTLPKKPTPKTSSPYSLNHPQPLLSPSQKRRRKSTSSRGRTRAASWCCRRPGGGSGSRRSPTSRTRPSSGPVLASPGPGPRSTVAVAAQGSAAVAGEVVEEEEEEKPLAPAGLRLRVRGAVVEELDLLQSPYRGGPRQSSAGFGRVVAGGDP